MKVIALAAFAAVIVMAAPGAGAQTSVRVHPSEQYCMDRNGDDAAVIVCQFNTMEQCVASKRSPGERCYLNPYLAFEQQRKRK